MPASGPQLRVENVGPMRHADVRFGDLTVLVGPQATGKSLFLQFLKLVLDHRTVVSTLSSFGLDWRETPGLLDLYLGRGMSSAWSGKVKHKSCISWRGEDISLDAIAAGIQRGSNDEQCFIVPAQRVLTFSSQSWFRPFSDFRTGDPYVIRAFSEHLRRHTEEMFALRGGAFGLDPDSQDLLQEAIFGKYHVGVELSRAEKELVLAGSSRNKPLPFMVWSAGQREFVPLMLALMWLLPKSKSKPKQDVNWVVIEEPEAGLHPKAISAVLFVILQLLVRGYRVCLSTHSTHVLDLVWALQVFRQTKAKPQALLELFGVEPTPRMVAMAKTVLAKEAAVFYFDDESRETQDISRLDPGDTDRNVSSWGKLLDFSSHVGEVVARQVANGNRK